MTASALPTVEAAGEPTKSPERGSRFAGVRFFAGRIGIYILTLFAAVTVNFLLPRLMPGDPTRQIIDNIRLRTGADVPPETVHSVEAILGNPKEDLWSQYATYLSNLAHGNLGISSSHYPERVSTLIGTALPWTVGLVIGSMLVAWLLGTALGVIAGWHRGRWTDTALTLVGAMVISLPGFWLALALQYYISYKLGILPAGGAYDPDLVPNFSPGFVLSVLQHALLPAITIVASSFAGWMIVMRNMTSLVGTEDYVLLARAKGLTPRRIMGGYLARNAILPNITSLAQTLGGALGGVLLIEIVFTYPGLGSLLLGAVQNRDYPLMQGVFLLITIAVVVMNFIADSIYVLIDPRIREVDH